MKPRNNIQRAIQTQDPQRYRTRTVEPDKGKGRKTRPRVKGAALGPCVACGAMVPERDEYPWRGHARDCALRRMWLAELGPGQEGVT